MVTVNRWFRDFYKIANLTVVGCIETQFFGEPTFTIKCCILKLALLLNSFVQCTV